MRFKHFEGKTLSAARAQVRRDLGDDALITATHDLGGAGYRIVCALEPKESKRELKKELKSDGKEQQLAPQYLAPRQIAELSRALAWHQFPFEIIEEVLDNLTQQRQRATNEEALESALERMLSFAKLEDLHTERRALLFFGPPGAGKTATCVKLAWLARLARRSVSLISLDSLRTGGAEQLEMYAEKIGCRFFHSRSTQRFERLLRTLEPQTLLFIDAPGINPYAKEELSQLQDLMELRVLLPILVLPTWIDTQAGIDLVSAFRMPDCRHIVLTGEDIDRRLGRSIAIARAAALKLTYISPRPHIAQGLELLDQKSLSHRCLKDIPASFLATSRASLRGQREANPNSSNSSHPAATPKDMQASNNKNHKQETQQTSKPSLSSLSRLSSKDTRSRQEPVDRASAMREIVTPPATATGAYRIAIASGKGGVGKTAIAIGLAHSLANLSNGFSKNLSPRVLLFDADLGLANIDIQLGLKPSQDLTQSLRGACSLQDCISRVPQGGFDAIVGKSGVASFAELAAHRVEKLLEDLQDVCSSYDTLLMDLGAGIDRTVRSLTVFADEVLIVVNDEPTSLTDAYALIKVTLRRKSDARISVVVNMAESERRGEQAFESLHRTCRNFLHYELSLAGVVRRDMQVVEAIRKREPLMVYAPGSDAGEDITRLARVLAKSS